MTQSVSNGISYHADVGAYVGSLHAHEKSANDAIVPQPALSICVHSLAVVHTAWPGSMGSTVTDLVFVMVFVFGM